MEIIYSEKFSVMVLATIVQYFNRVLPNTLKSSVGEDISIAIAIYNKYFQALSTEDG